MNLETVLLALISICIIVQAIGFYRAAAVLAFVGFISIIAAFVITVL